ncbi:MAG: hypothetical protein KBT31_04860, partial [Firmicutes bacterium]|nr:hypothetical protein [Candidatus Colimorpha enterica]
MNISLVIAGLAFCLEPGFGFIDVIPDFIGLLMIYFGVRQLARIDRDAEKCVSRLKNAVIANLLR